MAHKVNVHELYFSEVMYEGTQSCLMCHKDEVTDGFNLPALDWLNRELHQERCHPALHYHWGVATARTIDVRAVFYHLQTERQ